MADDDEGDEVDKDSDEGEEGEEEDEEEGDAQEGAANRESTGIEGESKADQAMMDATPALDQPGPAISDPAPVGPAAVESSSAPIEPSPVPATVPSPGQDALLPPRSQSIGGSPLKNVVDVQSDATPAEPSPQLPPTGTEDVAIATTTASIETVPAAPAISPLDPLQSILGQDTSMGTQQPMADVEMTDLPADLPDSFPHQPASVEPTTQPQDAMPIADIQMTEQPPVSDGSSLVPIREFADAHGIMEEVNHLAMK